MYKLYFASTGSNAQPGTPDQPKFDFSGLSVPGNEFERAFYIEDGHTVGSMTIPAQVVRQLVRAYYYDGGKPKYHHPSYTSSNKPIIGSIVGSCEVLLSNLNVVGNVDITQVGVNVDEPDVMRMNDLDITGDLDLSGCKVIVAVIDRATVGGNVDLTSVTRSGTIHFKALNLTGQILVNALTDIDVVLGSEVEDPNDPDLGRIIDDCTHGGISGTPDPLFTQRIFAPGNGTPRGKLNAAEHASERASFLARQGVDFAASVQPKEIRE